MNARKLIIIGANDFQDQLVLKAKELGYETHVFAWPEGAVAKEHADYFYPISITDKEKILETAKEIKPMGVISIASDLAVPTVNYVANALGLVANSNYSSVVSTNKYEMRSKFVENNLPSPRFKFIDLNYDLRKINFDFPLIVKPIDRSGSRGISKVERFEELKPAMINAVHVSFSDKVLVEEFVDGKEFSMEMISQNGKHNFIALTEKFTTGSPKFIETMHLQPARVDETIKVKAIDIIEKALNVLDIKYGASHSEFKVDCNNNIKIIEIGARMGGDCIGSDLVEISTGYDFKKMVIDVAVGNNLNLNEKINKQNTAFVKFIFNQDDLSVLNSIKEHNSEKIFRIGRINEISNIEVEDSSTRFGYFILKCNNDEECLSLTKYL